MSAAEPRHLRKGRLARQRTRRREAVKKVRAYRAWLRAGSDFRSMPAVPSSAEFRIAREERR